MGFLGIGRKRSAEIESLPVKSAADELRDKILYQKIGSVPFSPRPEEVRATGLSVMHPENIVVQYPHKMAAAAAVSNRFYRAVRFNTPSHERPGFRLSDYLSMASDHLYAVAQACGAATVSAEWALAETKYQAQPIHPRNHLVPYGYMLVANVASVHDIIPTDDATALQIAEGISAYIQSRPRTRLTDLSVEQFSLSAPIGSREPKLFLHDIDIRFN